MLILNILNIFFASRCSYVCHEHFIGSLICRCAGCVPLRRRDADRSRYRCHTVRFHIKAHLASTLSIADASFVHDFKNTFNVKYLLMCVF